MAIAQTVVGLCDRFKCLPSQLMGEDASLLRLVAIEARGKRKQQEQESDVDDY